jgi:hypothetical protein
MATLAVAELLTVTVLGVMVQVELGAPALQVSATGPLNPFNDKTVSV